MEKSTLNFSEWFLVSTFLLVAATLVIISRVQSARAEVYLTALASPVKVSVEIAGAVRKAGVYEVEEGAPLGEILKKAQPKPFADLSGLDFQEPVKVARSIRVGELEEILVEIKGEGVTPTSLRLPVGTRVCDLKSKLTLAPEADLSALSSRRKLMNREEIFVPKRK